MSRVANFAVIIKIATVYIKTTITGSKKFEKKKFCIKMQSISVILDITKAADFQLKNADFTKNQRVCYMNYMCFGSSLG